MKWLKDGLSVDETRISSLVLGYLVTTGVAMFGYLSTGDLSDNILTLLGYEIMAITGVNVADKINVKKKKSRKKLEEEI